MENSLLSAYGIAGPVTSCNTQLRGLRLRSGWLMLVDGTPPAKAPTKSLFSYLHLICLLLIPKPS